MSQKLFLNGKYQHKSLPNNYNYNQNYTKKSNIDKQKKLPQQNEIDTIDSKDKTFVLGIKLLKKLNNHLYFQANFDVFFVHILKFGHKKEPIYVDSLIF